MTHNCGLFNPFPGFGANPMTAFDNMKADGVLGMATAMAGPAAASNPALALGTQLAGRADLALGAGSPYADLLADTQNMLGAMANQGDGLGWSPQSAQQLLGRIGTAVASGGLSPEDAGLLGGAASLISQSLGSQPFGEMDRFGGAMAPSQPFGFGGNPFMAFFAGFTAQGGFGQGPF
jgi:hypothetical protein